MQSRGPTAQGGKVLFEPGPDLVECPARKIRRTANLSRLRIASWIEEEDEWNLDSSEFLTRLLARNSKPETILAKSARLTKDIDSEFG